jgi:hypothetical protein
MAEVQQPQPQTQPQPQAQQGGSGSGFEAQETMQGDGVAQAPVEAPVEAPPQPAEAPVMEEGGEVADKKDGLDWGLVFTFFDFRDE